MNLGRLQYFNPMTLFLKRRVATRDVVFAGTGPTIEIVGSWLSRRVATGEVGEWGRLLLGNEQVSRNM